LIGVSSDVIDGNIQCDCMKDIEEVYSDLLNLLLGRMATTAYLTPGDLEFTLSKKIGVSLDGGYKDLIEKYRVRQGI
jgi:hypothetical protein